MACASANGGASRTAQRASTRSSRRRAALSPAETGFGVSSVNLRASPSSGSHGRPPPANAGSSHHARSNWQVPSRHPQRPRLSSQASSECSAAPPGSTSGLNWLRARQPRAQSTSSTRAMKAIAAPSQSRVKRGAAARSSRAPISDTSYADRVIGDGDARHRSRTRSFRVTSCAGRATRYASDARVGGRSRSMDVGPAGSGSSRSSVSSERTEPVDHHTRTIYARSRQIRSFLGFAHELRECHCTCHRRRVTFGDCVNHWLWGFRDSEPNAPAGTSFFRCGDQLSALGCCGAGMVRGASALPGIVVFRDRLSRAGNAFALVRRR